ncbi:MAG TPA: hypothetical protein VMJ11_06690, partial [Paraburkholderia sp.]|nr:hypothetical protein [Paraburkholderia sp.]
EAKNIDQSFKSGDDEGIKKAAQRSLGETQKDGTQMSERWIDRRATWAMSRNVKNGDMTRDDADRKASEMDDEGYARWIFACLPGPTGSQSKLFVFLDIDEAGLNIEPPPKPAQAPQQTQDNGYN